MDVLWALQWCHQVKFGCMDSHEPGSVCRDVAVEEDFATSISAVGVATLPG